MTIFHVTSPCLKLLCNENDAPGIEEVCQFSEITNSRNTLSESGLVMYQRKCRQGTLKANPSQK